MMQSNVNSNGTKRIDWIDYAKGIAAMLVICLHIPNYEICKSIINSFAIPMFFILAGMTFSIKKERFTIFLKKRLLTLVWPSIAICGVLNAIMESVFSLIAGVEYNINAKKILLGIVLQMRGSYEFGAWFLICLFTSQILMYILVKYVMKKPIHILVAIVCFYSCGCAYSLLINKVLPWSLDVAIWAVPCVLFGYYLKETKAIDKVVNFRFFIFALIAFVIGNVFAIKSNNVISMYLNRIGNPIIAAFTIVGGFIVVAYVCKKIKSSRTLKFIGQNSLIIYCSQYAFIYFLDNIKITDVLILNIIIYFIVVLMGTMLESYLIKRFCPMLIGKKKQIERSQ